MTINTIDIRKEQGHIKGYVSTRRDKDVLVGITDHIYDDEAIMMFFEELYQETEFDKIMVIENVFVERFSRGQGIGAELIEEFIETAKENSDSGDMPILLIANQEEEQLSGFDLISFYERRGFELPNNHLADYGLMYRI